MPTVDLRWDIDEKTPAIINRVDILGNDVTVETCIRDQLNVFPGDVFNKDRLIQSYRNIANLGFFEQDMPPPETRTANENGDIDLVFHVKEKRTGNVNFGASVGQGTGLGGFLGFDQPNLFGECKRGSLQWQFGQYIRDFSLSYTDPRIRQTNVSGTISLYNQRSRFIIRDIGQSNTSGGQLQFGLPLPNSRYTRFYVSYGGERVSYGGDGLVGTIQCNGCFRSTLGFTLDHDTRLGQPFPVAGTHENIGLQLNGGPLGGTASLPTADHGGTVVLDARDVRKRHRAGAIGAGVRPHGARRRTCSVTPDRSSCPNRSRWAACSTAFRCAAMKNSRSPRAASSRTPTSSRRSEARSAMRIMPARPSWACG